MSDQVYDDQLNRIQGIRIIHRDILRLEDGGWIRLIILRLVRKVAHQGRDIGSGNYVLMLTDEQIAQIHQGQSPLDFFGSPYRKWEGLLSRLLSAAFRKEYGVRDHGYLRFFAKVTQKVVDYSGH